MLADGHWRMIQNCRIYRSAQFLNTDHWLVVAILKLQLTAYVRGICEGVEHHLWPSDSHPAYRGIRTLRSSKSIPRCTAVRAEGGRLLTEESEVKARWAGYLERLYSADPPAVELGVRGVTIPIAVSNKL